MKQNLILDLSPYPPFYFGLIISPLEFIPRPPKVVPTSVCFCVSCETCSQENSLLPSWSSPEFCFYDRDVSSGDRFFFKGEREVPMEPAKIFSVLFLVLCSSSQISLLQEIFMSGPLISMALGVCTTPQCKNCQQKEGGMNYLIKHSCMQSLIQVFIYLSLGCQTLLKWIKYNLTSWMLGGLCVKKYLQHLCEEG